MISRCLGLKETVMLSLQLKMIVDYLVPTDLITQLCVGRRGGKEGGLAQVCSRSLWDLMDCHFTVAEKEEVWSLASEKILNQISVPVTIIYLKE